MDILLILTPFTIVHVVGEAHTRTGVSDGRPIHYYESRKINNNGFYMVPI